MSDFQISKKGKNYLYLAQFSKLSLDSQVLIEVTVNCGYTAPLKTLPKLPLDCELLRAETCYSFGKLYCKAPLPKQAACVIIIIIDNRFVLEFRNIWCGSIAFLLTQYFKALNKSSFYRQITKEVGPKEAGWEQFRIRGVFSWSNMEFPFHHTFQFCTIWLRVCHLGALLSR